MPTQKPAPAASDPAHVAKPSHKFAGPFLPGTIGVDDACYIAYRCRGGTTAVEPVTQYQTPTATINAAFGGNYDPSQFYTRFPAYVPSAAVAASVAAYVAWAASRGH